MPCPVRRETALLWSGNGARSGRCLEQQRHLVSSSETTWAQALQVAGTLLGSYRHRRAWDWRGLCHGGHSPRQRGGHCCRDGTGTGDIHTVALGTLHLSLVAGRRWGSGGSSREWGDRPSSRRATTQLCHQRTWLPGRPACTVQPGCTELNCRLLGAPWAWEPVGTRLVASTYLDWNSCWR